MGQLGTLFFSLDSSTFHIFHHTEQTSIFRLFFHFCWVGLNEGGPSGNRSICCFFFFSRLFLTVDEIVVFRKNIIRVKVSLRRFRMLSLVCWRFLCFCTKISSVGWGAWRARYICMITLNIYAISEKFSLLFAWSVYRCLMSMFSVSVSERTNELCVA